MPSITKSISIMLLVGASANVLAAPSRRDLGDALSNILGETPASGTADGNSIPADTSSIAQTAGSGNLVGDTIDSASQIIGDAASTTIGVVDSATSALDGVGSITASGNVAGVNACVVVDPATGLKFGISGVSGLITASNGPPLPGCTTEQTQQCQQTETQEDIDAAKNMCPAITTCYPEEIANVWRQCMLDLCEQNGKCPCKECDSDEGEDEPKTPPSNPPSTCPPGKSCPPKCPAGQTCPPVNPPPTCPPGTPCCGGKPCPPPSPPPCEKCSNPPPTCTTCNGQTGAGLGAGNTNGNGNLLEVKVGNLADATVN